MANGRRQTVNDYSDLFNENMTSLEARTVLFSSVEGKTKEEIDEIFAAYAPVSSAILKHEIEMAMQGWMC